MLGAAGAALGLALAVVAVRSPLGRRAGRAVPRRTWSGRGPGRGGLSPSIVAVLASARLRPRARRWPRRPHRRARRAARRRPRLRRPRRAAVAPRAGVGETAVAMVLLVGAGLLLHAFLRLRAVDPGPDPDRTLTVQVFSADPRYARRRPFARPVRAAGGDRRGRSLASRRRPACCFDRSRGRRGSTIRSPSRAAPARSRRRIRCSTTRR